MLIRTLRSIKNQVVDHDIQYRPIRFGIAAGLWMPLDRRNQMRVEFGLYEWSLAGPVRRLLGDASVAYDVGSAQGYYVLAFCDLMGSEGRVYAFEADEEAIRDLRETLMVNDLQGQVELVHGFVGDRDEGEMLTIDRTVGTRGWPAPDVVKVDVEGAELKVLRGMRETIARAFPSLILEVHSEQLERQCYKFLIDQGYSNVQVVDVGWLGQLLPEGRPAEHNRWLVAEA